jgi:hypothetical protein
VKKGRGLVKKQFKITATGASLNFNIELGSLHISPNFMFFFNVCESQKMYFTIFDFIPSWHKIQQHSHLAGRTNVATLFWP